jgi:hypothetical protein
MTRALAGKRDTMRWAVTAAIAFVLACTAAPYPSPDYSLPLPPGVDSVASRFISRVGPPRAPGHDRPRPGNCSNCVVIVHIDVLSDTRLIDPEVAPAQGVALAHLVNLDDTDEEAYFNLLPHTTAEYYVWVDDGGGKPRATLLEISRGKVRTRKQWKITLCHPFSAENPPTGPDFDFYEYKHGTKKCTVGSGAAETPQVNYASLFSATPLQPLFAKIFAALHGKMAALRGDWIECSSGCCT